MLTFETNDGEQIEAMLGPLWHWHDNRIPLEAGDSINVSGFQVPDFYLMLTVLENTTTGDTYRARTDEGIPMWRGAGMRQSGGS
jgi:hypothetical protein